MNSSTLSALIVFGLALYLLAKMKTRDTGESALRLTCGMICGVIIALACCLMAFAVALHESLRMFLRVFKAEYTSRWNHIADAPARSHARL